MEDNTANKICEETLSCLIYELQKLDKKAFGYLLSKSDNVIDDYYIFSNDNRLKMENEFKSIGQYYNDNIDAGFMAPIDEQIKLKNYVMKNSLKKVGVFHLHRRHPAIISFVDVKYHPNEKLTHLIISLRNKLSPELTYYKFNNGLKEIKLEQISNHYFDSRSNDYSSIRLNEITKRRIYKLCKSTKEIRKLFTLEKINLNLEENMFTNDILKTVVTNEMYSKIDSNYPSNNYPVVNISYLDMVFFCVHTGYRMLNQRDYETLLTEQFDFECNEHSNSFLIDRSWYSENSTNKLQKVMQKEQYKGIFDLYGNVWELSTQCNGKSTAYGGSFRAFPEMMNIDFARHYDELFYACDVGFRIKKG